MKYLPQIIYFVLVSINLLTTAYLHGKMPTLKFNIFTTLLQAALMAALLWWGGFFAVFGGN